MKHEMYNEIFNKVNLAKNAYIESIYNRGKENNSEDSINKAMVTYNNLKESLVGFSLNDKHQILRLIEDVSDNMFSFAQTGKVVYLNNAHESLNKTNDYIYSSISMMDYEVGKF